jgi:hypothetical protein
MRSLGGGTTRTSLALKGRLAGGWNGITNRRIAEAGMGIAIVLDSDRTRDLYFAGRNDYAGDFHAVSLDVIATYAPDRRGGRGVARRAARVSLNGLVVATAGRSAGRVRATTTQARARAIDGLQRRAPAMTAMRQQWTPGRKRLSLAIAAALTAGDHETMPVVPSEGGAP